MARTRSSLAAAQRRDRRCGGKQMLQVVEHEQQPLASQILDQVTRADTICATSGSTSSGSATPSGTQ